MNLADLSIRRPIFITCVVLLSLVTGLISMSRLGVDLFPDVTFPVVTVTTPYLGAGPAEIETLVTKPIEDELSTISGIRRLSSINQEGVSIVVAEFTLETDVKYAEQQVRDRISAVRYKLPDDVKESTIRRIDPADQPILTLSLTADLPPAELYDLANEVIRPQLEQVNQVGLVEVLGGRRREIQIQLDREKLKKYELSASLVVNRLTGAGENIPSGKESEGSTETIFRTVGQFKSLDDIKNLVLNFFGNDVPVRISDIAEVKDTLEDEKTRTFVNGEAALFLNAYRQSGSNTIEVVDSLKKRVAAINERLQDHAGKPEIKIIRDGSVWIRNNVNDVYESIIIGVILAVVVVYFFLANGRSTIITGLALPNSLIGAFVLMAIAGFSINILTLLALSLSVGLLIDDAIVVRENIFRHLEMGKRPIQAALDGTGEVRLAVIATTLTVIAVFGPLGFLKGIVGQFFKQFGLTVCFAMAISLFDALTIAPMLSAYFAGRTHQRNPNSLFGRTIGRAVDAFSRFQDGMDDAYEVFLSRWLKRRGGAGLLIGASILVFILCMASAIFIPRTFLPNPDAGEFTLELDMPPGTNLETMTARAIEVDKILRSNKEIELTALTAGSTEGDSNTAEFYVKLIPADQRRLTTTDVKVKVREQLQALQDLNPKVKDYDPFATGLRPFALVITGSDQAELEKTALAVLERLKKHPGLVDVDIDFRSGKPEFQVVPDSERAQMLGVSTATIGMELRTQIEGVVAAKYREKGIEYDVRVRLRDDQRNLKANFDETFVPNMNFSLVRLKDVATPVSTEGPSRITRMNRARYVQISADVAPDAGLGDVMDEVATILKTDIKLGPDMDFTFIGQGESFEELGEAMAIAMLSGIIFIYLVLSSLYESFITPFTIMLALPLAVCGSVLALAVTRESFNIFSMIGIIMLIGVATKNSILLVDYANQLAATGMDRIDAIIKAGRTRLRPILMTTMALMAGSVPIAIGLNEASKQRTSMGIAIIGGLVSSTLLTLIVVPAAYSYIDRFRIWSAGKLKEILMSEEALADEEAHNVARMERLDSLAPKNASVE